jgi:glycosyltransferase involved in cell wall biosynthesis
LISFPSLYEGFGMPILEGQATGRPVLTSASEPMAGVAGAGGARLVDPHSESAIREGFIALIGNPALRERLVAAGLENCQRYALSAVAARYLALYRELDGR